MTRIVGPNCLIIHVTVSNKDDLNYICLTTFTIDFPFMHWNDYEGVSSNTTSIMHHHLSSLLHLFIQKSNST